MNSITANDHVPDLYQIFCCLHFDPSFQAAQSFNQKGYTNTR